MAAVAVSSWALKGTTRDYVIGDYLHPATAVTDVPQQYLTPGYVFGIIRGFTGHSTFWRAGAAMISKMGGLPPPAGFHTVLAAPHTDVSSALPGVLPWDRDRCTLDLIELTGAEVATLQVRLRQKPGLPCMEWFCYATPQTIFLMGWSATHAFSPASRLAQDIIYSSRFHQLDVRLPRYCEGSQTQGWTGPASTAPPHDPFSKIAV
ncbi:unnamed protein product [Phytophthora fragariaefolia]|uniref:Unnamed protein product n=1 Tax=Phytophthora fragariaefolia TaxID=1490495 RepID=A0A9W6Y582_9STRA|nr:unnamed protein product [Phytophthora fragariaefolia]